MKQHKPSKLTFGQKLAKSLGERTGLHTALDVLVLFDCLHGSSIKTSLFVMFGWLVLRPFAGLIASYVSELWEA